MRIIIADHQPKVRFALRVALEQQPGVKTVSEAMDAQDLLAQTHALCADLAIIDWELPGLSIQELIRTLHHQCCETRVIILNCRSETRQAALAAGADAFVCKCDAPDGLLSAIDLCLAQRTESITLERNASNEAVK